MNSEEQSTSQIVALTAQTAHLNTSLQSWNRAGLPALASQLDPEAIQETLPLSQIAHELSLPPQKALSASHRLQAITTLLSHLLSAQQAYQHRRKSLAEARHALRAGAAEFARGTAALRLARQDVERRVEEAEQNRRRAGVMKVKAAEYDAAAEGVRREVARSGVVEGTRHERVVDRAERVFEMEERLERVRGEVERFCGLPAVGFYDFGLGGFGFGCRFARTDV